MTSRYRWRTALRVRLPRRPPLYLAVPKGRDCGDHQWYRSEGHLWHCYHCRAVRDDPQVTSGGGGRQRLNPSLAGRNSNNVYGLLYDPGAVEAVVEGLTANGWSSRRSAWDEYELTIEWCSFTLGDPGGQAKLGGVIDEQRLEDLGLALTSAGVSFSLELYDEPGNLVREIRGGR